MRKILVFLSLLAAPLLAHAELYKWVDSNGKVQYSDQPPAGTNAKTIGHGKGKAAEAPAAQNKATPKSLADKELEESSEAPATWLEALATCDDASRTLRTSPASPSTILAKALPRVSKIEELVTV